jgi:Mn-containing catalase
MPVEEEFVNQFYNDSTGEGEMGEDYDGPWNSGGDWERVDNPAFEMYQENSTPSSPPKKKAKKKAKKKSK